MGANRLSLNFRLLIGILCFGLLLRLLWALYSPNTLSWDEPTYHDIAVHLAAGQGFRFTNEAYETAVDGLPTSFEEPVWPIILALVYQLLGQGNLIGARIVQVLIGSLLIVTSYGIGQHLNRPMGLVFALFTAVYPPFVYFSALLMSETPYLLFQSLVLLLSLLTLQKRKIGIAALLGISVGLTSLTRGVFLGIIPLLVVWLWVMLGRSHRAILLCLVMLIFATGTIIPWTTRNWLVHNEFVLISTKIGYNLYFYNYPSENTDFFTRNVPLPNLEGLTEVQRQKEFLRQGIFFLTHNPYLGKFVLVKFIEFWNPLPNSSQTLLVVISVLSMLLLLTLTTLGLLSFMKRKRPHLNILLYGMALFYIAVALIFFGGHRARLPAEYLLLLSSAPFLETVLVRFKEKKIGSLGNG
jgi:hypothetical protein